MTYLFYSIVCLGVVVLQTVLLPQIPGGGGLYDMGMMFTFYLALFRPLREGLGVVLILGFVMDNLSGAPFGLYITIYFWLYLGVKWVTRFLRVRNVILLPLLIASGVLVKNLIFVGTILTDLNWWEFKVDILKQVVYQLMWATVTGPFLLMLFNRIHFRWDQWMIAWFEEGNGQNE